MAACLALNMTVQREAGKSQNYTLEEGMNCTDEVLYVDGVLDISY